MNPFESGESGGCQCGAVRYHVEVPIEDVELCHCRMCQKAHGAPAVTWGMVAASGLVWTRGKPTEFRSSKFASRGFCNECGTPLTFRRDGEDTVDLALATLDHPEDYPPAIKYGTETRMPWFDDLHRLPVAPRPASGKSYQHPDRDTDKWP